MSNFSGDEGSFSSGNAREGALRHDDKQRRFPNHLLSPSNSHQVASTPNDNSSSSAQPQQPVKKKRNLPGTPDPSAEVIALSPTTLMATNRFVCEICNKGFQRDQNLQLHRRGHNLPWKLKRRTTAEARKRVYVCPEPTCVHHNPSRALGDLTGIKKHYSRKHGEKKWKCDKCSKKYAVQSDWKAHQKTCGTREYKCDCGTIFSRRDSFITHRAFCDALAEENNKVNQVPELIPTPSNHRNPPINSAMNEFATAFDPKNPLKSLSQDQLIPVPLIKSNDLNNMMMMMSGGIGGMFPSGSTGTLFGSPRSSMPMSMPSSSSGLRLSSNASSSGLSYLHQDAKTGCQVSTSSLAHTSATNLLQKAAQMGITASNCINSPMMQKGFTNSMAGPDQFSSIRPSLYKEASQQQINTSSPYEHQFQTQPELIFTGTVGNGGFTNHLLQKTNPLAQETVSHLIDNTGGMGPDGRQTMTDHLGIFSNMYGNAGDHQGNQLGFTKANSSSIGGEDRDSSGASMVSGKCGGGPQRNSQAGPSRFGAANNTTMMTVDFLGIGAVSRGAGSASNFHEQHMLVTGHFEHGESAMEKQIWDV